MKTYKDYYKEYEQTLPSNEPAPINENERSLWILNKWEQDNNTNESEGESYIIKLRGVYGDDVLLFLELEKGYNLKQKAKNEII